MYNNWFMSFHYFTSNNTRKPQYSYKVIIFQTCIDGNSLIANLAETPHAVSREDLILLCTFMNVV